MVTTRLLRLRAVCSMQGKQQLSLPILDQNTGSRLPSMWSHHLSPHPYPCIFKTTLHSDTYRTAAVHDSTPMALVGTGENLFCY